MKVGITAAGESGRISPVFETAESLLVLRFCRNGQYSVLSRESLPADESEKISFLRENGFHLLICGALCNETLAQLRAGEIQVVPFASGAWESVAQAVLKQKDTLPPHLVMPGCCGHHKKCCQKGQKNENCRHQSGK